MHSVYVGIAVCVVALRMCEVSHGAGVFSKNNCRKRISLLCSQAVKLMSEEQITVIGEDLQYLDLTTR